MTEIDVIDVWPIRLHVLSAAPSPSVQCAIKLMSLGRAPLRSPMEVFAMQLDRESAIALRRLLEVAPAAVVPPDLEGFRQELLERLGVFLASDCKTHRKGKGRVTVPPETGLYPRWFIESVTSRGMAETLARVAKMFPAVRSATVIDARQWVLLQLDREDALCIRDALLMESPAADAREIADRFAERLGEMIDVPYSDGGAWV